MNTTASAQALGLRIYLLFVISWFLHLGARIELLGALRIDLLLIGILLAIGVSQKSFAKSGTSQVDKWLRIIIIYALLTIPFVEWPGSVLSNGIPNLIKAVVFYYFTVAFVVTESDLKKFVTVFVACQLFRIFEPLYLHLTDGYWGSFAYMEGELLDRLSGAPSDVINPNGLAFVICTTLPFLYFLLGAYARRWILAALFGATCIYALILTGSRTGMIGLVVIFGGIVAKSKRQLVLLSMGVALAIFGFGYLTEDQQDRYLSIVGLGAKNAATAEGRVEGISEWFELAQKRPVFGFGLGTSTEANFNFRGVAQPAHNLYAEIAEELGFVGMALFLMFIFSVYVSFAKCKREMLRTPQHRFLLNMLDAMQVWLWLNIAFSLASYGLSSYEWYLLAGLSVVLKRLGVVSTALQAVAPPSAG